MICAINENNIKGDIRYMSHTYEIHNDTPLKMTLKRPECCRPKQLGTHSWCYFGCQLRRPT